MVNRSIGHRVRLAYYFRRAQVYYWWKFNIVTGWHFIRLGFLFMAGKLSLVTTEECESNGGYKYKSLVISKRPFSAKNTYEDL